MITTQNLNEDNYRRLRFELINQLETSNVLDTLLNPIIDSVNIPTLGVGLNLRDAGSRNIIFNIFGIDITNQQDAIYANQLINAINQNWIDGQEQQLRQALNNIMVNRANDNNVPGGQGKRTSFAFNNREESIQAFNQRIGTDEGVVNNRVPNLQNSWERTVLVSLAFNNPALIGNGLRGAINVDDRAEAWFEIRYNSNRNTEGGIARRRYIESEIFGLYEQSNPAADFHPQEVDALKVFRMLNKHERQINDYEQSVGNTKATANTDITAINGRLNGTGISIGQVEIPKEEFKLAKTLLVDNFATLLEAIKNELLAVDPMSFLLTPNLIDGVFVAAATAATNEVAAHTVDRTDLQPPEADRQDDLIFGGIDTKDRNNNDVSGGNDTLIGADGNDLFIGGLGNDSHNGGDGIDTVSYLRSPAAVTVNLQTSTGQGGYAQGDTYQSIENIIGSPQADTITGNDQSNTILGLAGNDTINGEEGDDKLLGNDGNDSLSGGDGNDTISGGAGNDILDGGDGKEDTAIYSGNYKDYKLTLSKEDLKTVTIAHNGGTQEDGTDTLTNVEFAQFKDKKVPLKGLDLAFVIDTTGSMFDDIDAVKASANSIINTIFDDSFPFSRVAVVGYNDPATNTFLSFTDQEEIADRKTAAINAIDSISVGGGGDFPEAVNAGLIRALSGGAGEWNKEAVSRTIILFGDAPAKDTDLRAQVVKLASDVGVSNISGLRALSIAGDIETRSVTDGLAVTRFALSALDAEDATVTIPVQIFTIIIGNEPTTVADFTSLAAETGGKTFNAANAGEIVSVILDAIDEATQAPIAIGDTINTDTGTILAIDVLANDSDPNGDPLTIAKIQNQDITPGKQITLASGALVTFNSEGTLTYNPNGQFDSLTVGQTATDTFTYTISDGNGGTDTAAVSIKLTQVNNEIDGTSGRDELIGTSKSDRIIGLQGADKLTGGGGNDQFVYTSIRDRGDTITDFEVGKDHIVLTQLLDSLVTGGYNGTNAIADGYVKVVQGTIANNFSVQIDTDGLAGGDIFRPFIAVNLTNPGTLNSPSNFVF